MVIDKHMLRQLALAAQQLTGLEDRATGKQGVTQVIDALGHVQIDTISVVERAHHHILWTRRPDYRKEMLHQLQATDRQVFESWYRGVACYLPMTDFRFHRMRFPKLLKKDYGDTEKIVVRRIRKEGALGSGDFKEPSERKRGPWWDWKPAKRSLEKLFAAGHLMVSERRSFQRVYDLTERVLPDGLDTSRPSAAERARFSIRRSVCDQGFLPWAALATHRDRALRAALRRLIDTADLARFECDGTDYCAPTQLLNACRRNGSPTPLHILSPFDGLLRDRRRLSWLFGFECKLEAYFPASKRRWGYFCLPILWGDRFIGRLDPKADRRNKVLVVKTLMFEPGFDQYEDVIPSFARKLNAYAAFNSCDTVTIQDCRPRELMKQLRQVLS